MPPDGIGSGFKSRIQYNSTKALNAQTNGAGQSKGNDPLIQHRTMNTQSYLKSDIHLVAAETLRRGLSGRPASGYRLLFGGIFALCVTGCASPPAWTYDRDTIGTPIPAIGKHDLTAETSAIPVFRIPRSVLDLTRSAEQIAQHQTLNGRTVFIQGKPIVIQIADDLTGWRFDDTLHHERIHVICQLTKDPSCTGHFLPITDKNG